MNIFVLDIQPPKAAKAHCDKHVVKMTLEYAQILATALQDRGYRHPDLYKPTHTKHPCCLWAMESFGNYYWLWELFASTAAEYTFRFGKNHQSYFTQNQYLSPTQNRHYRLWSDKEQHMTPFVQAMPDEYKKPDAIEAYRAYYCHEKASFARYTNRNPPDWLRKHLEYQHAMGRLET